MQRKLCTFKRLAKLQKWAPLDRQALLLFFAESCIDGQLADAWAVALLVARTFEKLIAMEVGNLLPSLNAFPTPFQ